VCDRNSKQGKEEKQVTPGKKKEESYNLKEVEQMVMKLKIQIEE
jgi:hypothetical protein